MDGLTTFNWPWVTCGHWSISHNATWVILQHGGVMYKNVSRERAQWQMLRVNLPHLKYFQRGSRSFCQVSHYNPLGTRLCSLTDEQKLSSTVMRSVSLCGGYKLKSSVTSLIPFTYLPTSGDLKSGDSLFCTTPFHHCNDELIFAIK